MVSPSGEGGVQVTLILVGPSWTAVTSVGGEAAAVKCYMGFAAQITIIYYAQHTCHSDASRSSRGRFVVRHSTCVDSSSSHSQSVGVLCSHWIIQHSLSCSFSDSGGVSGPSDSGSRSTSGDTGEGQLVRVICHISRY